MKYFTGCTRFFNGGLRFLSPVETAFSILKTGRNDACYIYIFDTDFSGGGRWEKIGTFVKIA